MLSLIALNLILASSASAIVTGDHGGNVTAPGLVKSPSVSSAVCTTGAYKIFFSEVNYGNRGQGEDSTAMTYTVLDTSTNTIEGRPNSPLKYLSGMTGYEADLLKAYVWYYDASSNYNSGFVSFYMEDVKTVKSGTYDMKARLSLIIGNADINVSDADCSEVEVK